MNNMIDPRTCKNFRIKDVCPNRDHEILAYLDNRVVSDLRVSLTPEMFDKSYEYCANCAHFAPLGQVEDLGKAAH